MKLRNKKTGEVYNYHELFLTKKVHETPTVSSEYVEKVYTSIAELNEEWEDYKPVEPLIKDEKIRKTIRAWAEACNIDSVFYSKEYDSLHASSCFEVSISFLGFALLDLKEKTYTITQLCGEEE